MPIQYVSRRETPWIAEDAVYVYKGEENKVHQVPLTYGRVCRRMLDRIDDDMMRTIEEHGGLRGSFLAKAWGGLASAVHRIDWLVRLAIEKGGNAFYFERRDDGKLIRLEEYELGRYCCLLAPLIFSIFDGELDLDRFSLPPRVELFRDVVKYAMDKVPHLHECFEKLPTFFDTNTSRFCGELANDLFALICREAEARGLDDLIRKNKAEGDRRYGRMQKFKCECFEKQKKLLLVLVECAYQPELAAQVPLAQAKRDHSRFVNRLRGNVKFAAVAIGGIWTLAWGERKGHHFRWIFMLDGSLVQDSTEWAEFVGNAWKGAVPEGAGYVRIRSLDDFPSPATGLVHVDDAERMKMLNDEIEYGARKDSLIQLKETVGERSWGRWIPANTREDHRRQ
jgi:hypothetical protein